MEHIEDIYQLAPVQEGLLFHTLYEPHSAMYIEQFSYTIQGQFDVAAFRRAWQLMVTRHQVLRAGFFWEDLEAPLQVVQKHAELPFTELDWRQLPPAEQERQHAELVADDREQGFDLAQAPLMRITVIQTADDTYRVIWTHHHLLLDGWSSAILLRELFTAYAAFSQSLPAQLPPIRPYGDYIAWLQEQDLEQAERFWRGYLAGFAAPTSLGVDHPARALPADQPLFASQEVALTTATTDRLQSLARQHQLTLSSLLQGAWALLLSYYSGEHDIVFGATSVGRPPELDGIESMIGLFINTLPTRFRIDPSASLLPWLQSHLFDQAELRQYEYTPLVRIQGWSEVPRGLPLFESMIVLDNYPAESTAVADSLSAIKIVGLPTTFEQTNYPLTVVGVSGSALGLRMMYDRRRFDDPLVARMLVHFQTLLEQMALRPESRLGELSPLSAAERRQVLDEWNATERSYPRESVPALVEQQAARAPEAIAVVFGDEQCTYAELNTRANQLAHHLQSLGVRAGTPVGICLERSLAFVVGVLGILKAGGAYVPLDPSYPAERLQFMLQDTVMPVLMTVADLAASLPPHHAQVVCLDRDAEAVTAQPTSAPLTDVTAEHLAYVMYTSGSTGRPKGIGVPHRAIIRLVCNTNYVQLTADDRIAMVSNVSFDAATFELWGALIHGGRLIGVPREVALAPQLLATHIRQYRIDTIFLTTALFNQIARVVPTAFSSMREVLFGGEAVDPHAVAQVLAAGGPRRLLHVYGPTESTTFASCFEITEVPAGATTLPIGYSLANTQLYVLDRQLEPVAIGVPGELYIGGDGLAHGYLNQPTLTAEKFIPDSFRQIPGSRLYRTGDRVRMLAGGAIEFLGRIDQQVKLRGFRIELGEIEAVLSRHEAVRNVVVVVREDVPGDKRLVAYVVGEPGVLWASKGTQEQAVEADGGPPCPESTPMSTQVAGFPQELRQFLQERLPDFMVPSVVMLLPELPLTANGKIDRKALPEPDRNRMHTAGDYIAPRETYEVQLVQIWEDVLGVHPIGVTDTFFNLGGHSMSAVRLMSRVQSQFGQQLPLSTLFESPTVEALASVLRNHAAGQVWSPIVALQAHGSRPPFFCVHPGGGTIVCYLPLAQQLDPEQPFYGVQALGLYGDQQPLARVEDMAAVYIAALREVQPDGPYFLGGWSAGGVIAFEMAQQLSAQGEQVELLALLDAARPASGAGAPVEDDREVVRQVAEGLNLALELPDDLEPDELLSRILEQARQEGKVPPDISLDEGRRLVQLNKTIPQAVRSYAPVSYPGRAVLFRSTELPADVPADAVLPPQDLGWNEIVQGGIEVIMVPGNHLTMVEMPQVAVLARHLQTCLDRAQSLAIDIVGTHS